jgi:toll-interacting protein
MAEAGDRKSDRRNQVLVGELPPDFLRLNNANHRQIAADHQTAAMMQAQIPGVSVFAQNVVRLGITIAQANLNKNYGITKMDPYCRVRVGHAVFETHTAHSGGRNPVWNKVIHATVPPGVDSIYLEIFDERAFALDDRVAWAHITIPERVFKGETAEEWFPLNGRLGEEKEGTINLVLSFTKVQTMPVQHMMYSMPSHQPMVYPSPVVMSQAGPLPAYYGYPPPGGAMPVPGATMPQPVPYPQHPPQPQGPLFTEDDVKVVKDMFPNIDEEVVRSVLEANGGNKDATINNLLGMDS